MYIEELELQNVGWHRQLNWKFKRGAIGIMGRNGSGKSSAVNAVYAAFTGDFGRFLGGITGAICQQAPDSEPALVRLVGNHHGQRFEIHRFPSRDGKCRHSLQLGDKPLLRKAGEIQHELEDVLGIKRRLLDEYIFVQQGHMADFLSAQDSVRAQSFAQLCNTTHAERCWKLVGDQLNIDTPLAGEFDDSTDAVNTRLGEYRTKLRDAKGRRDVQAEQLLEDTERKRLKAVLRSRREYKVTRDAYVAKRKELADSRQSLGEDKQRLFQTRKKWYAKSDEVISLEAPAKAARRQLESAAEADKQWQRKQALQTELDQKKPPKKPTCDVEIPLADLQKVETDVTAKFVQRSQLLELRKKKLAKCPTCGTSAGDLEEEFVKAEQELPGLKASLEKLVKQIKTRRAYETELTSYRTAKTQHESRVGYLTDSLAALQNVNKPAPMPELRQAVSAFEAAETEQRNLAERTAKKRGEFEAALKQVKTLKTELAELAAKLKKAWPSKADVIAAKQALQQHRAAEIEFAATRRECKSLVGFINEQKAELERLRKVAERNAAAKLWVKRLQAMREVLHRDRLPKRVHLQALRRMESRINKNLGSFMSPFRVTTDDNLNFQAQFPNGTRVDARALSKGEQVLLSLGFRFAVNSLFAPQIGMLVLDEPTAELDEENVAYLQQALQRLSEFTKSVGSQLIVITHERELEKVLDQSFVLEK